MAASVALPGWRPLTLTDRRNDITTVDVHRTPASFASSDVISQRAGVVELWFHSGNMVRRVDLRIANLPAPSWLEPTLSNCAHLLMLPFGWDGDQAPAVEIGAMQSAFDALCSFMAESSSAPQWTPTRNGGVQLDWHENAIDLEIEFNPNEAVGHAVFSDHHDEAGDWDGPISENAEILRLVFAERLNARPER
jgi:hypothetical protein